jgi:hypothetical protein
MAIISWRRLARFSFLLLALAPWMATAHAATYYVSPAGSNTNPGTLAAPFATLQRAHDVANPGDTIYMRGGTYRVSVRTFLTRSGSSGGYIKVFNYPGEVPVLDAAAMTAQYDEIIRGNSISWWHIKGLEVKNGPDAGIHLAGASSNNIIELCVSHHNARLANGGKGISISETGSNNLILNNDVHHNRYAPSPGGADGISVASMGAGNVVRGNRVWRNSDDGIDLWGAANVLVENNWVWENGYDDNLQPLGNGVGFKLGGATAGDGAHTIRNNLAWRNKANGFSDNGANLPTNVFNNTAYGNGGGSNYAFFSSVANVLKNNIALTPNAVSFNGAVQHSYNSWNLGVTVSAADFLSLDDSGATGPRGADGSLPAIDFLKLAAGSDLIGRGTNVGLPFTGSAPDLGAYQHGTSGSSLPAPTGLRVISTLP